MFEDVPAVVIDNGTGMIKAGMAGDEAPKAYFPTVVGYVKFNKIIGTDRKDCAIGDDAIQKKGLLSLKYPLENGIVQNWSDMEKIWRYCYFDQLKTDPEIHPVLLTEAALNPKKNREKMMEIFFDEFKVPGFYVYTQAVLALYASGRTTGLVCDSGDGVSHIVVVYDGYSIRHATSRMDLAGRDMTDYLQKYLSEDGYSFQSTSEREIARDIKERLCYVSMNYEEELSAFERDQSKFKEYELPDTNTIKIGDVLIRTPEIMFKPHLDGKDFGGIHE